MLLLSADFFQNQLLKSHRSGTLSECQMVWIQIWVVIWVQTQDCGPNVGCFSWDIFRIFLDFFSPQNSSTPCCNDQQLIDDSNIINCTYSKYSKSLTSNCIPKRPRQTMQIQTRLLLKRSSLIRVFPVFYFDKHFVNSSPDIQHFI